MAGTEPETGAQGEIASTEVMAKIGSILEGMPNTVELHLFTKKGENDVFNDAARDILKTFADASKKVILKENGLDHELARKHKVDRSPTILLDPDNFRARWLGAPAGNEIQSFFMGIVMLGTRRSDMSDQSRKVIERIDSPRDIRIFVSITCPFCPQQVVNCLKAVVEKPDMASLEIIDVSANPDLAEESGAQSVPQTFANGINISAGAQPEELFMASLEKLEKQVYFIPDVDAEVVEADLVVIGGGPAGLTAGIYASRSGLDACIVERASLGGQIATTPMVENYTGFTMVGGKMLADLMVTHALQNVPIFQNEEVMEIEKGERFTVTTNRRRFMTRAVLLATGATYRHLGVPGESRLGGLGVSYCATCDGPLFKGKKVLVVGGGNSAATEALYLSNVGADVTMVHRRESLRAQQKLVEQINSNSIPVLWNSEVREIRGEDKVKEVLLLDSKSGKEKVLEVDGVFVAIGYSPEVGLAKRIGLELTEEGFVKHKSHRTNVAGIYSAGDVEGGFKQIVTAVGQGAEAALTIYEDLSNPYWKSGGVLNRDGKGRNGRDGMVK